MLLKRPSLLPVCPRAQRLGTNSSAISARSTCLPSSKTSTAAIGGEKNAYSRSILPGLVLRGVFFVVILFVFNQNNAFADEATDAKRRELNRQIESLEQEAAVLDETVTEIRGQARTLTNAVKSFDAEIRRQELEIRRLNLAVEQTKDDITQKSAGIAELSEQIDINRNSLSASLLFLYSFDQRNLLTTLFKYDRLSEFFHSLDAIRRMQLTIQDTLSVSREDRALLTDEKEKLTQYRQEQQELKSLEELERRALATKRAEKDQLLKLTKGNEELFNSILELKQRDISTLKTQLFYLEKTGITAEDAIAFAELAASRTGIRTAFLLALLEVETGKQFENGMISVGSNLGTGHWKRDLYDCYVDLDKPRTAEGQRDAFFEITKELGFDPDKMPVSRRPNYGCGGAMGPAQFLPGTWVLFKRGVARLTGHNPPNPWNVEDAFTAAALLLAEAGATSKNDWGEIRAAKTYISGQPTCSRYICNSYSNRIISLARDIDRVL